MADDEEELTSVDVERLVQICVEQASAGRKLSSLRTQLLADGLDPRLVRTLTMNASSRLLSSQSKAGWGSLAIGLLAIGAGIGVTAITYTAAADSGGTYVALWGAVLFGAFSTWRGLRTVVSRLRVSRDAANLLRSEGTNPDSKAKRRLTVEQAALGVAVITLAGAVGAGALLVSRYEDFSTSDSERVEAGNRNASNGDTTASRDSGDRDIFDLEVGDCFRDPSRSEVRSVEVVSCSSSQSDGQVTFGFTVPSTGDYPGEDYFDEIASDRCPSTSDSFFFPTTESWKAGDKAILCLELE